MVYLSEIGFEAYIRDVISEHITKFFPEIYALDNKKAVDILICKEAPNPELFFIEVKYHKIKHGRLGFGSSKGGGFQPEILTRKPVYFENNLRWVLASEEEPKKILFLESSVIRNYLAGGKMAEKFNNIQKKIFKEQKWLDEQEFITELKEWLNCI